MVTTATDLREAGIRVPLLVGGAALSEKFTRQKIAPQYATAVCYAKDAMTGLRLMNDLSDSGAARYRARGHTPSPTQRRREEPAPRPSSPRARSARLRCAPICPFPQVAYLDRKVRHITRPPRKFGATSIPTCSSDAIWAFADNFEKALAERDPRALELFNSMEEIKPEAASFMKISAVWQFFEAERRGNSIALFAPGADSPAAYFPFPAAEPSAKSFASATTFFRRSDGQPRSRGAVRGHAPARASARSPKTRRPRGTIFFLTVCRHWRSKPPRPAPNGCIAASAKIGVSLIRQR